MAPNTGPQPGGSTSDWAPPFPLLVAVPKELKDEPKALPRLWFYL